MNTCFRCGASIASDTAFCPECGAPQIRVAIKTEPADAPVAAEQAHAPEPLPPGLVPGKLHWGQFLRSSWLLLLLTAIGTAVFMPVGLFLLLPGSVVAALRTYGRQQYLPLRAGQGAALGAGFGLASFLLGIVPHVLYFSTHPGAFQEMMNKAMHDAILRAPDPQTQKTLTSILSSHEATLAVALLGLLITLLIYTIVGSVAGASTVALTRDKSRP